MKPSTSLYWIRAVLGVSIGALNALYDYAAGNISASHPISINDLLTGLAFAMLFFVITYYVLKIFYVDKFQKKSKVLSTGIGTYFILWIMAWVLIDSVIRASIGAM
jgi:uncharacterized membrane protein YwzB